jgi:hypothetical protein
MFQSSLIHKGGSDSVCAAGLELTPLHSQHAMCNLLSGVSGASSRKSLAFLLADASKTTTLLGRPSQPQLQRSPESRRFQSLLQMLVARNQSCLLR